MKPPSLYRRRMVEEPVTHDSGTERYRQFSGSDPNIGHWGLYQTAGGWIAWFENISVHICTLHATSPNSALKSLKGEIENLRRTLERLQNR